MTWHNNPSQPPTTFDRIVGSNGSISRTSGHASPNAQLTPLPTAEPSLPWFTMVSDSSDSLDRPPPPLSIANSADIDEHEFDELEWDEESARVTSLSSSLLRNVNENGRSFHKFRYGRYPLPNDAEEQDRDWVKHAMTQELTEGKLFLAPLSSGPHRVIDLGTGPGHWAIEVADRYPAAEVIGVDLSPIQPTWIPPNLKFIVDDIEDTWIHGGGFDLIHIRFVIPLLRYVGRLFTKCFENAEPGGWIEVQEFGGRILCDDDTIPPNYEPNTLLDMCEESLRLEGMEFRLTNHLDAPLREAGFVNVRCKTIRVPVGTWAKHKKLRLAGYLMSIALSDFFTAMAARSLLRLGLTKEALDETVRKAKEGLDDKGKHGYFDYHFWTAQKPPAEGTGS